MFAVGLLLTTILVQLQMKQINGYTKLYFPKKVQIRMKLIESTAPTPTLTLAKRSNIGTTLDNALTLVLNADYKPLSYVMSAQALLICMYSCVVVVL